MSEKNKTVNCVELQRNIRNKMLEECHDTTLKEMVAAIKKNLMANKIWLHLSKKNFSKVPHMS